MTTSETFELKAVRDTVDGAAVVRLLSPGVGLFTDAAAKGTVLTPGQRAGYLVTLGKARELLVPAGVSGLVRSEAPEAVRAPVDYGAVLFELEGLDAVGAGGTEDRGAGDEGGGLVFTSPQAGRFWHRQAPTEPPLIEAGMELGAGQAIGLIEVMKTFTHVTYDPKGGGLPERAKVTRIITGDGEEIAKGAPLFEVEAL